MRRLLMALAVMAVVVAPPARAQGCGDRVDEGAFATEATLAAWNQVMSDLGSRPTASPAHEAFVDWIEDRLGEIDGLELRTIDDELDRWLETGTSLVLEEPGADAEAVAVAAARRGHAVTLLEHDEEPPPPTPGYVLS